MTNTIIISRVVLGSMLAIALAVAVPSATHAIEAPTCVLNAIVQPTNGGGTTLSWLVRNAHTASLSDVGLVAFADALVVYPQTTTTYTLTATGAGGTTTCAATAMPVSSYSFNSGTVWSATTSQYTCKIWTEPDQVVAGGSGIVSWDAGSATNAYLSGFGSVSTRDSRVVPNTGVPQTFTLTAEWGNGVVKQCSATLIPVGVQGAVGGGVYMGTPAHAVATPYIAINQIPYTGTDDTLYMLFLVLLAGLSGAVLYIKRDMFVSVFRGS